MAEIPSELSGHRGVGQAPTRRRHRQGPNLAPAGVKGFYSKIK